MSIDSELTGGTAEFDETGAYRYSLTRAWNHHYKSSRSSVCWIMLNPSTADAHKLDPTIRKCVRFSQAWDYDGIEVVNVYGYRSTDPKKMLKQADPVGNGNSKAILRAMKRNDLIVAAWGVNVGCDKWGAVGNVLNLAERARVPLYALRISKDGHPGHPLYVPYETNLVTYREVARHADAKRD